MIAHYKKGTDKTVEISFTTRDGSVIIVENQGWVDEKAGHIDFLMTDITERKQAENALREAHDNLEQRVEERTSELNQQIQQRIEADGALRYSEMRFKDFAEGASDWFWEMDENLRFSYFSDRFPEISGVAKEDLIGKTRQESGLDMEDEGGAPEYRGPGSPSSVQEFRTFPRPSRRQCRPHVHRGQARLR